MSDHVQKILAQGAIREGIRDLHASETDPSLGGGGLGSMCGRIEAFLAQARNAPPPQCIEEGDSTKGGKGRKRGGGEGGVNAGDDGDDREIHLNLILGVFEERKAAMAAAGGAEGPVRPLVSTIQKKEGREPTRPSGNNTRQLLSGGGEGGAATKKRDIMLPSKEAEEMLFAEKLRDSHAVLSMFSALADTRCESGHGGAQRHRKGRALGAKGKRKEGGGGGSGGTTTTTTAAEEEGDDAEENVLRCAERGGGGGDDEDEDDNASRSSSVSSSDDEVVIMDADDLSSSSDDEEDAIRRAKGVLFGGQKRPLIEEM